MKCVALGLVFLLAAGCQAHFVQADARNKYETIRAEVVTYLTQAKASVQKAVANLDDAEFKDFKTRVNLGLDKIEAYMKTIAEQLAPLREETGPQIVHFFSSVYEKVSPVLEELRKELEPKWAELHRVVKNHLINYLRFTEPLLNKYFEKNHQVREEFNSKYGPLFQALQKNINVNLEETKSNLTPIVEDIRSHLIKALEVLKTAYGPIIQEYREQIEHVATRLRHKYETGELQMQLRNSAEKIKPHVKDIGIIVNRLFTDIIYA